MEGRNYYTDLSPAHNKPPRCFAFILELLTIKINTAILTKH